jgi:hypothetical protein
MVETGTLENIVEPFEANDRDAQTTGNDKTRCRNRGTLRILSNELKNGLATS